MASSGNEFENADVCSGHKQFRRKTISKTRLSIDEGDYFIQYRNVKWNGGSSLGLKSDCLFRLMAHMGYIFFVEFTSISSNSLGYIALNFFDLQIRQKCIACEAKKCLSKQNSSSSRKFIEF